jgi:hypothetical protein
VRNARNAQGSEANDSSTQKRRSMQVVESIAQRVGEVCASDDGRGISPIDIVAGIDRIVAEVLATIEAESASAVDTAEPRNTDASSDGKGNVGRDGRDDADDLMPGHDRRVMGSKVTFDDIEIGAANTAGSNRDENLPCQQRRNIALLDVKPIDCHRTRGTKHRCGFCCDHAPSILPRKRRQVTGALTTDSRKRRVLGKMWYDWALRKNND